MLQSPHTKLGVFNIYSFLGTKGTGSHLTVISTSIKDGIVTLFNLIEVKLEFYQVTQLNYVVEWLQFKIDPTSKREKLFQLLVEGS